MAYMFQHYPARGLSGIRWQLTFKQCINSAVTTANRSKVQVQLIVCFYGVACSSPVGVSFHISSLSVKTQTGDWVDWPL